MKQEMKSFVADCNVCRANVHYSRENVSTSVLKKRNAHLKNVVRVPFFGRFDAKSVLKLAQFVFQRFDFCAKNFVGGHLFF